MTNDPTSRLAHHLQSGDLREIAVVLVELERERGVVSFSELSDDPFAALETQNEFAVEYTDVAPDGCSVFGYYRASPPTIYVHPSVMGERDNFTLLHEYGHHVQRQHMQWADLWLSLPDWESARVNEAVADSFAAEVLMPEDRMPFSAGPLHARAIRDAHSGSRASRQALVMRAVELAPGSERAVVAITDLDGRVTFARSTCDEPAPRRGAIQPGLKVLVEQALQGDGFASGAMRDGIVAASGWAREDMIAEVALDHLGRYAFAVIRPETRYSLQRWEKVLHECPNPACEAVFEAGDSVTMCGRCEQPKCRECGTCSCERAQYRRCPDCNMELSVAESSGAVKDECW